jgi:hypothetical protein
VCVRAEDGRQFYASYLKKLRVLDERLDEFAAHALKAAEREQQKQSERREQQKQIEQREVATRVRAEREREKQHDDEMRREVCK